MKKNLKIFGEIRDMKGYCDKKKDGLSLYFLTSYTMAKKTIFGLKACFFFSFRLFVIRLIRWCQKTMNPHVQKHKDKNMWTFVRQTEKAGE